MKKRLYNKLALLKPGCLVSGIEEGVPLTIVGQTNSRLHYYVIPWGRRFWEGKKRFMVPCKDVEIISKKDAQAAAVVISLKQSLAPIKGWSWLT